MKNQNERVKIVFVGKYLSRHYDKIVHWSTHIFYFAVCGAQILFSFKTTDLNNTKLMSQVYKQLNKTIRLIILQNEIQGF